MEEYIIFLTELVEKFKGFDHKQQFNLLIKTGCGRRETLHSNLIVDFLNFNPKYLELFLKEIDVTGFNDYRNTKVYRELPTNGFIDIYILNQNQNKAIIIENKVDDPGKSGQLQKYYDEIEKKYPNNVTAFYLTKYGNLPPNDADCKRDCLSYEKHIVGWLEECIKKTDPSDHRIKESLEIYVELVRDVINRDKYMEKVFDYLRGNDNSMSMAIDIYRTLNGRNFFQDEKIREEIKELFENYIDYIKCENTGWMEQEIGDYELTLKDEFGTPIGAFLIYPTEIYAEFPGPERIPNTKKLVPGSHIVGNNLSDDRLKAILTNKTDVIHEYLNNCISQMREK